MKNCKNIYYWLLSGYIILLFYMAFLQREPKVTSVVQRDLHLYIYRYLSPDFITNILVFIPFGFLVGMLASKYRTLAAGLVGLFMSETIECSQLIWKRGTFDVDDLLNNTLGTAIGGLLASGVMRGRKWFKG